ncbi:hypothetical protein J2Z83_002427 [Virgibacillus natechei]|uniref:Uncharacterized protein n=1 Tax=Virgibacillus natechei TaxID=1216297 RepID=A0ABS4IH81_9BACI|nr:hypothetical protein [Virgibacillus natechei]MBP1970309.1 hypothetical protein [Virgibacillus natechei]UZD13136.1 hypothetical protein OLD84_00730 [Virgibacillus natechei]
MNLIAYKDSTGTPTKFDLFFFKCLHLLTLKRSNWVEKQIRQINKDKTEE